MMSVAEEVAWVADLSGQSVADLLAIPATAYYAVKDRVLHQVTRDAHRAHTARSAANRQQLMADLKRQMGRG